MVEEVEEAGIRRIILPVNLFLTMNCFPRGQVLASKQHAVKDTNAVRNHKNTPDKGWATIEILSRLELTCQLKIHVILTGT